MKFSMITLTTTAATASACGSITIQPGDTCSSIRNTCSFAALQCQKAGLTCTAETSMLYEGDQCYMTYSNKALRGSVRKNIANALVQQKAGGCWLEVDGPAAAPAASSPCAVVDVAALNKAEKWDSGNAYLVGFYTNNNDCLVASKLTQEGQVPAGLASPNGKYVMGPYSIDGKQAFAVYDKAPTVGKDNWVAPAGYTSTIETKDAKIDATTVTFSNGAWVIKGKAQAKNTVQEVVPVRQTVDLVHGKSLCVDEPSADSFSALDMLTASDQSSLSLQRKQGTSEIWAVNDSCDDFNKAKAHMDCLKSASCEQYTTEQFGAPFPGNCVWQ